MKELFLTLILALPFMANARQSNPADSLTHKLQEVVVTARQPATKLVGTTLVSTIPGTNLENLGTALDLLAQLPMMQVADDAVSVIGKGSPEIYIDGRPISSEDELIQLRSGNIKKVELVMAPGAMYAGDTRAVVKITTRHNFVDGLSFLERAEGIARRKFSVNNLMDLNYRAGKWDFFLSGLIAGNNSLIKGATTNTLIYKGKETVVGSSQHKNYHTTNGIVKPGFNYSDGIQSFGAYYRYNPERGHFSNTGKEWLDDDPRILRDISSGVRGYSHRGSLYYDNTLSGKYLLHFDGDFKYSYSKNDARTSYPEEEIAEVNSADTRKSTLWAGKLYLSFPLAKGGLTVGTQNSYTRTSLDYNMFNREVSEYIPSSFSEAKQTSAAVFASWSRQSGRFSLSAGLRYEYVDYAFTVNGRRDDDVSRRDNLLTPDLSFGYRLNDEAQVSLSYKMATVKPPYSRLTGSLSYVGIYETEGGNPALKDEHIHDIQLFGMYRGFMLQTDYTRSLDSYAFVKRRYRTSDLQLLMQPINIDVSAVDLCLVWSQPVKAWIPNVTLGMHKQWLDIEGTNYSHPIFSYYFDNTISLPKEMLVTINASGQSKGDMHTNRFGTTWFTLNASVSKSFFNKALQLKIAATDLFNTRNNNWTMNTCGVFVNKRQTYDSRGVSLTVTYRFQPRKSKYKGEDASKAEINRL